MGFRITTATKTSKRPVKRKRLSYGAITNHLQKEVKNSTYSQTYPNKSHLLCDLMASGFTLTHKSWSQALENASNYTNQYVFIDCLQSASCHTKCYKSQLPNVRPQPSTAPTPSGLINSQALTLVATHCHHLVVTGLASWPMLTFSDAITSFNFSLLLLSHHILLCVCARACVCACVHPHLHCCFFSHQEPP